MSMMSTRVLALAGGVTRRSLARSAVAVAGGGRGRAVGQLEWFKVGTCHDAVFRVVGLSLGLWRGSADK
jgi:hypothetical protein